MHDASEIRLPAARDAPYPPRSVAWYAAILLALLFWLAILDRFILSLLIDPIKRDLGLTDVQFGLLQGFAFSVTFALFGLTAGVLTDRFNRRWTIFAGVSIWSLSTAACGLAQNFWHLTLARIGVGAGEATLNPCATSMLSDLFPRERLTSAMTVYTIGATIGAGSSVMLGGAVVQWVNSHSINGSILLPLIGQLQSWQAVFCIIGAPGLFLSLAIFTVPEPLRRGVRASSAASAEMPGEGHTRYGTLLRFMRSRRRFFTCHYLGFAIGNAVFGGCAVWYASHLARNFGWKAGQIGLYLGLCLTAGGVAGKLILGPLIDALFKRGYHDAQMRVTAACLLLATPVGVITNTSSSPWIFVAGVGVFTTLLAAMPACSFSAMNLVTPNELRGKGVALFSATAGLVGSGGGPLLIAAISDHIYGGHSTIGLGMATVVAIFCPIAAGILALGMRPMRNAVALSLDA
jgi:MFS family permease